MANPDLKIYTEPHNPFLLETFQAFTAEGLPVPVAVAMVQAHVAHGQMAIMAEQAKALGRIADSLGRIASLTDPVDLGRLIALVRAGDAKRAASAAQREAKEEVVEFNKIFRMTDAELAS